ncbi:hypothetical protein EDD18DRAFT_1055656, partial [Armillaria luteobubalina]
LVPVPLGLSIPRRDCAEVYDRYCRLMLILFKPWVTPMDLRDKGQSWVDVFRVFAQGASRSILDTIDNMQILHECKDSRD